MTNFQDAIKFTLKWEGGYVNHPKDPGGETKYGIADIRDGKKDGANDSIPIKDLTLADAMVVYKRDYWDANNLDTVVSPLCIVLFDMYVNHRPSVVRKLREESNDNWQTLIQKRKDFYGRLVAQNPSNKVFLKGWLNRANDLWTFS